MRWSFVKSCWAFGGGYPANIPAPVIMLGPAVAYFEDRPARDPVTQDVILVWCGKRTILHMYVEPHLWLFGYTGGASTFHHVWIGPISFAWTGYVYDSVYAGRALFHWFNRAP